VIVEEEGAVLGVNLRRPIVTNGDFVAQLCESDALFLNYFGEDLLAICCPSGCTVVSGVVVVVVVDVCNRSQMRTMYMFNFGVSISRDPS